MPAHTCLIFTAAISTRLVSMLTPKLIMSLHMPFPLNLGFHRCPVSARMISLPPQSDSDDEQARNSQFCC